METIESNWKNAASIEKMFLVRYQISYQVSKNFHTLDHWDCLVGIEVDMLMKQNFSIKDEPQIFPSIFGIEHKATYGWKVKRRWIERPIWPGKVENFSFGVSYMETKLHRKRWNNIVTIEKKRVRNQKRFALSNKTIVYKG